MHTTHKFVVVTPWHYVQSLPLLFGAKNDPHVPKEEAENSAILPEVWRKAEEILEGEDLEGEEEGEELPSPPPPRMQLNDMPLRLLPDQSTSSVEHIPVIDRCHALINNVVFDGEFGRDVGMHLNDMPPPPS